MRTKNFKIWKRKSSKKRGGFDPYCIIEECNALSKNVVAKCTLFGMGLTGLPQKQRATSIHTQKINWGAWDWATLLDDTKM